MKERTGPTVRELIDQILCQRPNLTMSQITAWLPDDYRQSPEAVRSTLSCMFKEGILERTANTPYAYRISTGKPRVVIKPYSIPPTFTGPALSPMDWSMRHLLGK